MVDATPSPPFENPCIVAKPLTTDGGLERYLSELARALDAPVYTARKSIDPEHFSGIEFRTVGHRTRTERLLARLPLGAALDHLEYANLSIPAEFDAVITLGEPAKAVVHRSDQRRYHLLNMPSRWLFDRGPGRFDDHVGPRRLVERAYQSALRGLDVSTIHRIDDVVVPSETIGRRLETYYGRSPTAVVYPPVDTSQFEHEPGEGYLLYVGRLAPQKRVREIVETLSDTEYDLKVVGTGPLESELRTIAGPNVDLLGYVDEARKRRLLARCDALVFNSDDEAFGIVPVEAFASGKPVIGVDDGYTRFQIDPDHNGVLFERGGLLEAVEHCSSREWDADAIVDSAQQYDAARFRARWQGLLFGDDV